MNEQEGLKLSWDIAVENGFEGSFEDYMESLDDSKNLEKAFDQAKKESFPGDMNSFVNGLGLGKSNGVVAEDATVAPEMQASENTVLESEDISSGLEKPKKEEDKIGTFWEEYGPMGFIDLVKDVTQGVKQGYKQSDATDINYSLFENGVNSTDEEIEEFIKINKDQIENSTQSAEYKQFVIDSNVAGGGFWGSVVGLAKNPTLGAIVLASSMANQIGSIV